MDARQEDLHELATAVTFLVENAYRGMARTFDVTRMGLLRLSATGPPIRPSDAAAALAVAPSTITRYAALLEHEGLVAIIGAPQDGRSCLIAATAQGRAELARFDAAGANILAGVLHDWSADDIRQFTHLIRRLASAWTARGPVSTRPPRPVTPPRWRSTHAGGDAHDQAP